MKKLALFFTCLVLSFSFLACSKKEEDASLDFASEDSFEVNPSLLEAESDLDTQYVSSSLSLLEKENLPAEIQDWVPQDYLIESYMQSMQGYSLSLVSAQSEDDILKSYGDIASGKGFGELTQNESGQYAATNEQGETFAVALTPIDQNHHLGAGQYAGQTYISIVLQLPEAQAPQLAQVPAALKDYLPDDGNISFFYSISASGNRDGVTFLCNLSFEELEKFYREKFEKGKKEYLIDQDEMLQDESENKIWSYVLADEEDGSEFALTIQELNESQFQQTFPEQTPSANNTFVVINYTTVN